jgi:hypothetical protein
VFPMALIEGNYVQDVSLFEEGSKYEISARRGPLLFPSLCFQKSGDGPRVCPD